MLKLINIGCGSTYSNHPAWTNVDLAPQSSDIHNHDIRKKLPYPDAYFDACYSSHVIEHLKQHEADQLIAECWRVLKPQGIIRAVVPDLESIARHYISTLEQVESGVTEAEPNYDWIMLELYDQTVRHVKGGEMASYLADTHLTNKEFIRSRIGSNADIFLDKNSEKKSWIERLASKDRYWFYKTLRKFNLRTSIAKYLVTLIAGNEARQAFEVGLFRNSGEIHYWMYDRFSLRRLLERSGFVEVRVCGADSSRIQDFNSYGLDMLEGKVRKPDSLFMEGIKP
ncbi:MULTISPECIES: methyltransferase domain-containing protein [unclassified Moorena]|uniref:class I SAM-dependent methyltransferase n=1 Tax=unclassified Moorena TaxID=2683338 RepID=UPI001400E03D|nr:MULTISPECIES: methyltransferase domain-containing protein [unclassified Moorena]NEO14128.1 methyltransferase domain-containing protein [Moorena sp. SIO3E8]NEQ00640.1 methyltransferase domain-containing protein [Moorena sp. SIO3F7]